MIKSFYSFRQQALVPADSDSITESEFVKFAEKFARYIVFTLNNSEPVIIDLKKYFETSKSRTLLPASINQELIEILISAVEIFMKSGNQLTEMKLKAENLERQCFEKDIRSILCCSLQIYNKIKSNNYNIDEILASENRYFLLDFSQPTVDAVPNPLFEFGEALQENIQIVDSKNYITSKNQDIISINLIEKATIAFLLNIIESFEDDVRFSKVKQSLAKKIGFGNGNYNTFEFNAGYDYCFYGKSIKWQDSSLRLTDSLLRYISDTNVPPGYRIEKFDDYFEIHHTYEQSSNVNNNVKHMPSIDDFSETENLEINEVEKLVIGVVLNKMNRLWYIDYLYDNQNIDTFEPLVFLGAKSLAKKLYLHLFDLSQFNGDIDYRITIYDSGYRFDDYRLCWYRSDELELLIQDNAEFNKINNFNMNDSKSWIEFKEQKVSVYKMYISLAKDVISDYVHFIPTNENSTPLGTYDNEYDIRRFIFHSDENLRNRIFIYSKVKSGSTDSIEFIIQHIVKNQIEDNESYSSELFNQYVELKYILFVSENPGQS